MDFLALIEPGSYSAIGWTLLSLAALAVSIEQIARLWDRLKTKEPTPPLHEKYATKEEVGRIEEVHSQFRAEVRASFDEAANTSRLSREKIYVEQHRQAELLAKNTTQTDMIHHRTEKLDSKMDRLLERMPQK